MSDVAGGKKNTWNVIGKSGVCKLILPCHQTHWPHSSIKRVCE